MAVARFTLAVDRRFKRDNQPTADFISCICFRKTAEFVEKYCKKGTKLVVEGSWQTGNYTNKDGDKVYTNDCLVDNCEFAESKSTAEQNQKKDDNTGNDDFMNIPDGIEDGLPFN
jgi:single-strand DNA-binding protein